MADKPWSQSVGSHGSTITVKEREFGGILYLQWYEERKTRRKSLGYTLRSSRGKIIEKRKKKALQEAEDHRAQLLGESPVEEPRAEMTLQRAFELFFRTPGGHYASASRNYKEVRRYADRIERVLGADTLWSELVEGSAAKKLWRQLARDHLDHEIGGHRSTERTVGVLLLLGDWLVEEHDAPPLTKPKRWTRKLKTEWGQIIGREPRVSKPRFSRAEFTLLDEHRHLLDPRADLLFDLAFGQRAGQHLRLRRSDIDLERTAEQPWGSIYVEGRGKKRAGKMHLTESQYRHLQEVLDDGYLRDLERRYRSGELEDYVLFPGGRLRKGRANPKYARKPVHRTWVGDRFRELESLAGVDHQTGRGWNGVRRTAADLAEDVTDDARVLRAGGGWTNDATRRGYQDQDRPEIRRRAAEVRAQIRGDQPTDPLPEGEAGSEVESGSEGDGDRPDVNDILDLLEDPRFDGHDLTELLHAALESLSSEEGS